MIWTDERCDQLRALYTDGLSASAIAEEMGISSRGAVCGKLHRLGLARDSHPSSANRKAHPRHRKPRPAKRAQWQPSVRLPAPDPASEPATEVDDTQIPLDQRRTLDQLTNSTCRWPVGDPSGADFFFCGHPSADLNIGIPYCAAHAKRATQGSPPARPYIPMRSDRS